MKLYIHKFADYPSKEHASINVIPEIRMGYANFDFEITLGFGVSFLFWHISFHLTIQKHHGNKN